MFKKIKFSISLFVIASLASLILLSLFFFFLRIKINSFIIKSENKSDSVYYLNKDYNDGDPLITKIPSLSDILSGPIISELDPSIGNPNSSVAIIYFSDYECDYCHEQEAVLKNILEKYEDKIRIIWKDYPESNISFLSSVAARCAFEQGRFIEYHDLLYERDLYNIGDNESENKKFFVDLAGEVGLKKNIFKECLDDKEIFQQIFNNILEAQALDIGGIPFIYINDQEIMGASSEEEIIKIIDIELNKEANIKS